MVQRQEINGLPTTAVTTEPSTLTSPEQALYYRPHSCGKYVNQGNQPNQARRQILHAEQSHIRLIISTKMQLHVGLYTSRYIGYPMLTWTGTKTKFTVTRHDTQPITTVHGLSNTQNNTNWTYDIQEFFPTMWNASARKINSILTSHKLKIK
jgi:hypothetical protein